MAQSALSYAKTYKIEGVDIAMEVSGARYYIQQYKAAGLHVAANTFLDRNDIRRFEGYGMEYSLCNVPLK